MVIGIALVVAEGGEAETARQESGDESHARHIRKPGDFRDFSDLRKNERALFGPSAINTCRYGALTDACACQTMIE
jgi:hypothetical protein